VNLSMSITAIIVVCECHSPLDKVSITVIVVSELPTINCVIGDKTATS
jgi:hypothetical protein